MTNDNDTKKNLARAKRSDLDAMQARFNAIVMIIDRHEDIPANGDLSVIYELASGDDLDSIIREAGIRALGLES